MTAIDITSELERFETHLENNPRTIFSAKFGDGKTYFLKEYIERHKEDTVFIVLHPINYSVATNEDVFEYIKRDVLVELSKEPEFRNVNWKAVAQSIFNIDTLLDINEKLIDVLPETYGVVPIKQISKLAMMPVQVFKKVDDEVSIDKYFERFADMKGGIFEQDQYTEAIKAIIQKIQEHGKKCVLIIEDLDRIDPGHLFRILNVLGAHIDEDENSNKFGFDNIVAVLDYDMTEHIFHHFYGEKANYGGYMSKFTSHNIFEYSVARVAVEVLENYLKTECKLENNDFEYQWVNHQLVGEKSTLKEKLSVLSVRDVVNVLDDIDKQYTNTDIRLGTYWINPQVPIVKLLAILTRMNIRIEASRLMFFVQQNPKRYELLGAFILTTPAILCRMLKFGNEAIMVGKEDDGGGRTDVKFQGCLGGEEYNYREHTAEILQRILENVHDCKLKG